MNIPVEQFILIDNASQNKITSRNISHDSVGWMIMALEKETP